MSHFVSEIKKIANLDERFQEEAYSFVMESLHYYNQKNKIKPGQHITARELLEGVKEYALQSFGPMALFTLSSWGINETKDVGIIVFNMIGSGLMGKTDTDTLEDFSDIYHFRDVFPEDTA